MPVSTRYTQILVAIRNLARRMFARAYRPSFVVFMGVYVALVAWFKWVDLYHSHFATAGALVVVHNVFRVVFIFYLFAMVHAVGAAMVRVVAGRARGGISLPDHLALGFFAGTGVWHAGLLVLGVLNLYTVPVALAVTLPAVALSHVTLVGLMARTGFVLPSASRIRTARVSRRIVFALAIGLALAAGAILLMVKGLYPGGGHDYFVHYFYYYQTVIDHGGLQPNDVWYHYYYSKGAGLFFLGILLTDPLAPQLVTFCFMGAGALALFLFVRRFMAGTLWPWIAVTLFLAVYIYTPGPGLFRQHGGWGDFEKLHELNCALLIGILWTTAGALERRSRLRLAWAAAAASAVTAAVIINITVAAYLGATLALLTVWFAVRRDWKPAVRCFGLAGVTAIVLIGILALNDWSTGLLNDQGMVYFWRYADVEKLARWGVLPLVLIVHWGTASLNANTTPWSAELVLFLVRSLRLDLLYPLVVGGLMVAAASMVTRVALRLTHRPRSRGVPAPYHAAVLWAALAVFLAVAFAAGRAQPISFYRYASTTVPLVIAAGIWLWAAPVELRFPWLRQATRWWPVPLAVLALCCVAAWRTYPPGAVRAVIHNSSRFLIGASSIDTAYTMQQGFVGRLPWGGIYPGARGAYAVVGPHTPIWTLHIHSYCMLPDCRMEIYPAFIMAPRWDRVMFGTAQEGKEVLQAAGINYFFFSRELSLEDPLPLSALFSPDNIAHYLGVRWTDGTSTLLTWLGPPDVRPLDAAWIADYRRAVAQSPVVASYPYEVMKATFAQLDAIPHPWRSLRLPWETPH